MKLKNIKIGTRTPLSLNKTFAPFVLIFFMNTLETTDSIAKPTKKPPKEATDDSINPFDDTDSSTGPNQDNYDSDGPLEVFQNNHFQAGAQETMELAPVQVHSLDLNENLGAQKGSSGKQSGDLGEKDIESAFGNEPKKSPKAKKPKKKPSTNLHVKDTVVEKRLESKKNALAHEEELKRRRLADEVFINPKDDSKEAVAYGTPNQNLVNPEPTNQGDSTLARPHSLNEAPGLTQQGEVPKLSSTPPIPPPSPGSFDNETQEEQMLVKNQISKGIESKGAGMSPEDYDRVPQWTSGQDALAIDGKMRPDDLLSEDQSLSLLKGSPSARRMGTRGGSAKSTFLSGRESESESEGYEANDSIGQHDHQDSSDLAAGLFRDPFGDNTKDVPGDPPVKDPNIAQNETTGKDQAYSKAVRPKTKLDVGIEDSSARSHNKPTSHDLKGLPSGNLVAANLVHNLAPRLELVALGHEKPRRRLDQDPKLSGDFSGEPSGEQTVMDSPPRKRGVGTSGMGQVRSEPKRFTLGLATPRNSLQVAALSIPMVRDPQGNLLLGLMPGLPSKKSQNRSRSSDALGDLGGLADTDGLVSKPSFAWTKADATDSWVLGLWSGFALALAGAGLTVYQRLHKLKANRSIAANPTFKG